MQVFIMRHGQAEELAGRDKDRALTPDGMLESSLMARWLVEQGGVFQHALVSPYLRALQTFAQVNTVLTLNQTSVEVMDELTPHGDPEMIAGYIYALAEKKVDSLLIVSHMPLVSFLVESLDVQRSLPMFAPSSVARIEYDVNSMSGHLLAMQDAVNMV
ncbi:phosphohistidine phosphatase SixA [Corallincola platygyrae]|uniref:Phosphohistidine phosphatase SixA n=1 Tax=Corallincola platygyrae TaxID=1193278 RepID=A0ABW4XTY4_9GAMM